MTVVVAGTLALSGCVTGDDPLSALQLAAPADDAHCRSLLMQPGELVYAQCRLALRRTYLDDYARRKGVIEAQYGPLATELDAALRNDTFCNYDESVKASVEPVDPAVAADKAYATCGETRQALSAAFAQNFGADPFEFEERQRQILTTQNLATVEEARTVIVGPVS